jgi:hypothetical protein
MSDKLNIANEMAQLDRKNRKFYEELTDEEKKKFSNFLMIRWSSSVHEKVEPWEQRKGIQPAGVDMQNYYVQACNHFLNKHFFAINRHPKLQWLCATAVSPGFGLHKHSWIAPKKKENSTSASVKILRDLYPNMKQDELELLASITPKKEVEQLLRDHGQN